MYAGPAALLRAKTETERQAELGAELEADAAAVEDGESTQYNRRGIDHRKPVGDVYEALVGLVLAEHRGDAAKTWRVFRSDFFPEERAGAGADAEMKEVRAEEDRVALERAFAAERRRKAESGVRAQVRAQGWKRPRGGGDHAAAAGGLGDGELPLPAPVAPPPALREPEPPVPRAPEARAVPREETWARLCVPVANPVPFVFEALAKLGLTGQRQDEETGGPSHPPFGHRLLLGPQLLGESAAVHLTKKEAKRAAYLCACEAVAALGSAADAEPGPKRSRISPAPASPPVAPSPSGLDAGRREATVAELYSELLVLAEVALVVPPDAAAVTAVEEALIFDALGESDAGYREKISRLLRRSGLPAAALTTLANRAAEAAARGYGGAGEAHSAGRLFHDTLLLHVVALKRQSEA